MWTIKSALEWTQGHLAAKGDTNPRLSAQWLLCAATGLSRLELYTNYEQVLPDGQLAVLRDGIKRRVAREPLQYIMGKAPFRKLELVVRQGVLIPRPETEVLVDIVIAELRRQGDLEFARVLDVCTGTGNIALSLLHECSWVSVVATDNDPAAVLLARENARILGLLEANVSCIACDDGGDIGSGSGGGDTGNSCEDNNRYNGNSSNRGGCLQIIKDDLASTIVADPKMHGCFDVVVSNPPYIPTAELEKLPEEVAAYEPLGALDGGADGLKVFRRIVEQARALLKPGGLLACELFETSLDEATKLCVGKGFNEALIHRDLTNRPRIITARATREVSL